VLGVKVWIYKGMLKETEEAKFGLEAGKQQA